MVMIYICNTTVELNISENKWNPEICDFCIDTRLLTIIYVAQTQ